MSNVQADFVNIDVGTHITDNGFPRWGHVSSPNPYIIVAFKSLETSEGKYEHPLNKLACWLTARPGEIAPAGRMCHTEIMLEVSDKTWYRFSINKMSLVRENGKKMWKKGTVHCKQVSKESMQQYHYYNVPLSRESQKQMFDFLVSQHGAEFNKSGYIWNFFLPKWLAIGTRKWSPRLTSERRRWFCTEIACCALQSAGLCEDVIACCQSPNSLNRMCATMAMDGGNPVVLNNMSI